MHNHITTYVSEQMTLYAHTFLFRSNARSIKGINPSGLESYKIMAALIIQENNQQFFKQLPVLTLNKTRILLLE